MLSRPSLSLLLLVSCAISPLLCQESASEQCTKALNDCENDLECSNLLGPLAAACSTNTCQPQCRMAVMNIYQNKMGRTLLKSDATCIPGRDELKKCNFLPTAEIVHCGVAKLACEGDLQCQSKLQVFMSECEMETARGQCSEKCNGFLKQVTTTPYGKPFATCTCTDKEDQLCKKVRDDVLGPCVRGPIPTPGPEPSTPGSSSNTRASRPSLPTDEEPSAASDHFMVPSLLLCALLAARVLLLF